MENVLPKGWRYFNISTLTNKTGLFSDGDWVESKDQDPNGEVRLIQLADIGINEFKDKSDRFLNQIRAEELKCTFLEKNDVLIARMPDPIGRACVFPLSGKYATVVDVAIVRFDSTVYSPQLFSYFVNSPEIRKQITNLASGSTRQRVSRKNLDTINFPLPPFPEQQRIVAKLGNFFKALAHIQTRLDKIPNLLKNFRRQILTQAVTGKLTEEWREENQLKEWEDKKVQEFTIKVGSGATPKGGQESYSSDGIALIRSMNVHFEGIKYKGLAFIDEKQAKQLQNVEVKENDILLNITGASIGRVCLAPKKLHGARVNQHVSIIRVISDIILPEFLNIYLKSPLIQSYINSENYGVTRQALTKTQLLNITVKVPEPIEQKEIINRVEVLLAKVSVIEERYKRLTSIIEVMPQSILYKAFKGDLVEQLSTDGDAIRLL